MISIIHEPQLFYFNGCHLWLLSWKIFFKSALDNGKEKSQTLIRKEKLILCNMKTTNFSADCTLSEGLSKGRIRTEYIHHTRALLHQWNSQCGCAIISVQLPTHVCVLFGPLPKHVVFFSVIGLCMLAYLFASFSGVGLLGDLESSPIKLHVTSSANLPK